MRGIEPLRVSSQEPKSCASTNFATRTSMVQTMRSHHLMGYPPRSTSTSEEPSLSRFHGLRRNVYDSISLYSDHHNRRSYNRLAGMSPALPMVDPSTNKYPGWLPRPSSLRILTDTKRTAAVCYRAEDGCSRNVHERHPPSSFYPSEPGWLTYSTDRWLPLLR